MEGASGKASLSEVEEAEEANPPPVEDRVFVAVPEDIENGKLTLLWALENPAKDCTGVVIAHVHCPPQKIPSIMLGVEVHHSLLNPSVVENYRSRERSEAHKKLDEYVLLCQRQKVSCTKVIIEKDDVVRGLEELIAVHAVTKLVVGTRHSMRTKSKTALRLAEVAASSCKIWFTCDGHLVSTREPNTTVLAMPPTPARTSVSSMDSLYEFGRRSKINPWQDASRNDDAVTISGSALPHRTQEPDNENVPSPSHELGHLPERLVEAMSQLSEGERSRKSLLASVNQADEESTKRQRAGRDKFSIHKIQIAVGNGEPVRVRIDGRRQRGLGRRCGAGASVSTEGAARYPRRAPTPEPPASATASGRRDHSFNLPLPAPLPPLAPVAAENLPDPVVGETLVVDVFLTPSGGGRPQKVVERWTVACESWPSPPAAAEAATVGEERPAAATAYKRCIILLRSIYAALRFLPAYRAFRTLCWRLVYNYQMGHRVGLGRFVEPFSLAKDTAMRTKCFGPVETELGRLVVSVQYLPSLAAFNLEVISIFPLPALLIGGGPPALVLHEAGRSSAFLQSGRSNSLPSTAPWPHMLKQQAKFSLPPLSYLLKRFRGETKSLSIPQAGDDSGSVSVYHWNMSQDLEPGGDGMSPPSSTKSVQEDAGMQESPTVIIRSFKKADTVCIGDLDANLPSGSKLTMNPSGDTMDTPVCSSLGAMGPLLRKVDLLLTPKYPLRRSVKHAIQLLKEDLEEINDILMEQSMVDSPNNKGKYWMHEVRELSYDVEDAIDALMLPHIAGDGNVRVRPLHGHRVGRLKIKGLPNMVKPLTRIARVTELRTLLWEASERHQRYELDVCISNPSFLFSGRNIRTPEGREVVGNLVGIDAPRNELTTWLTARAEQLKVLCIVGPAGVGKTTLAKELYRELGSQFECRAFVRVSRTPHMSRLLLGILSQIQRPKQNSDTCSVPNIIDEIRKHLQDKRYFIVIDGLWEARVWDIIKSGFPKGQNCSRIMITCEVKDVATKFCSYHCIDVFELKPLGSQDSEKLFFDTVSAFNVQCHDQLKDVSCRILRECAGLPLAIIAIAGLLASQPDNSDLWHHLLQYFSSDLANLTLDELIKGTVNLCYNILPQDLKTCLLYLTMYPEGRTIRKVDLLKQWISEGFITPTTQGKEEVAENYFAELVNRGMIQPEKIMHNDEVFSCTVHHIVFDFIMHKSREENFTTAVDYSQTVTEFFMKVYRLSLHFSCAQYATKLEGIRLSQIRSLSFSGLLRCMPSVTQLRLLRVLILEFWDDNDGCISLNLSRISRLVLLRYLKISSHMLVELPSKIQELKFLETLEVDARVWTVPDDIVNLPCLLHLNIQDETKLPEGIGRVTSLQTLRYFNLDNNSEGNVRSLCKLINLRDLHITCSTALSDAHLKRKFVVLAASLPKLTNLRSLTMAPGAVCTIMSVDYSSAMLSTPMFIQRLELLPPVCIFSRLPEWIGKLQKLRILKIVVRVLLSRDIDVLTGLPGLTVLSLYIRQPNTQSVVFSSGALPVLKCFKYTCGALFLSFQEEALPNLERLKLRFNVHKGEMYYHMNSGIENLLNLKEMTVKIGASDDATESDKKAAESAIESAIRKHPRFPIYTNVRRIGWVEEV